MASGGDEWWLLSVSLPVCSQGPTKSFLIAATLIFTVEAGITKAAGTRLARQWSLVEGFKEDPF